MNKCLDLDIKCVNYYLLLHLLLSIRKSNLLLFTVMTSFSISNAELVEIAISSDRKVYKCIGNLKIKNPNLSEAILDQISIGLTKRF